MQKPLLFAIALNCAISGLATHAVAETKPQSLLDIYNQALARDPTLASALSANKAAQEIIEQGKALYRPIVNFNAGATVSRTDTSFNSSKVPFSGGAQAFEGYQYAIEARQPLYRKQNLVQMEQANTQVSLADKQLHLSQQALMLRTTISYFDVLLAQDKIELNTAQKAAILSQLEQAKTYFNAGTATITDVNEAQARYDLIVAQGLAADNAYEIAKHTVQAITGEIPQKLALVKTDLKTHAIEHSMAKWLTVASENNLQIQIQQDSVTLSTQEIERANAGHLPTVDAVASYNDNYANGGAYGFGGDFSTATIGVQLQIPLYQGGATSSRIRQAALNKQKAQDDVDIARRQTELETQRAYLNLNTSIAQVTAYEQALNSSQSQLDASNTGYEVGVRTSVDVLNAQQQLFAAKRDLLQARYSYLLNIIHLKSASGVITEADLADINQQLVLR
ncbi:MAG: TolC family outer membrane protein [Methylococcales bacterium]|nr:TolC family outer membrane protein [Methylococcales bacterium]